MAHSLAISEKLPETGFIKIQQIIGDKKRNIPAIIPIGRTSWYEGIKAGKYPAPIKIGTRSVAWRVSDIRALLESFEEVV